MPTGAYRIAAPDGGTILERFRCAPGPMGWRYFAERDTPAARELVDVSVDASWSVMRIRIQTSEHHLVLMRRGEAFVGEHDDGTVSEPADPGLIFEGSSPVFAIIAANHLRDAHPAPVEVRARRIDARSLSRSEGVASWTSLGARAIETGAGTFDARGWLRRADDAEDELWVAGDVLVGSTNVSLEAAYDPGGRGPRPR